jgi:Uma2 family endonuclease
VAFVRSGNQPRPGEGSFEGVPDLVVEVLSPGTRQLDRTVKLVAYRDAGVPEVWFCDPMPRRIQVLALSGAGKEYAQHGLFGPGETVTSTVLRGLGLEVDRVFSQPV